MATTQIQTRRPVLWCLVGDRPQGYKTFFMLNSAVHDMCPANKSQITNNYTFFLAKHEIFSAFFMLTSAEHEIFSANKYENANYSCSLQLSMKISLLINMKMPTIVSIFIFISRENFMLSWSEHEKSFLVTGPGLCLKKFKFKLLTTYSSAKVFRPLIHLAHARRALLLSIKWTGKRLVQDCSTKCAWVIQKQGCTIQTRVVFFYVRHCLRVSRVSGSVKIHNNSNNIWQQQQVPACWAEVYFLF